MAAAAAGELLSLSQVEFKPTRTYKSFLFLFSYSSAGKAILSLSSRTRFRSLMAYSDNSQSACCWTTPEAAFIPYILQDLQQQQPYKTKKKKMIKWLLKCIKQTKRRKILKKREMWCWQPLGASISLITRTPWSNLFFFYLTCIVGP
jgi:hypothetical protein